MDARNTGSRSGFLPQSRSDVLHFQLEAFMFQQGEHPYVRVPRPVIIIMVQTDLCLTCSYSFRFTSRVS